MLTPTRRGILGAGVSGAALGLAGMPLLPRAAAATDHRRTGFFRYPIGDITCTALYDGFWHKPHDAGFIRNASVDETRRALVNGGMSPDHVTIEFSQTLLETGGRTVIIDPGTGGQWVDTAGTMAQSLAAAGYTPADIDTILISHFHPDHIYGLMDRETDAQQFPDAEIIVPEAEYAFWTDPQVTSMLPEAWWPLAQRIQRTFSNWPNVRRVAAEADVAPGIRTIATPGHTPGHTAFHVSSGASELIVAGDVAITPALFVTNPGWHIVFDADPEQAEQTRRRLFDRVVADGVAIAGYHFGFPNAGYMRRDGAGYAFEPLGA